MIYLAVPDLSGNERKYLNECIDTTFVSSIGKFVTNIERLTAEKSGAAFAVATSSGTTGLHLALTGYGVGRDDLVLIPTFTFIATANAVVHCGASPWLIDIDLGSWTMSIEHLKSELETKTVRKSGKLFHRESGKRVAAIMPVYTLGNIPRMDELRKIANRYNLPIIADAAAALGATYQSKKIAELADATVFSFNGNKTVTAGGGGIVVCNDEAMAKKLKHLSTTARVTGEYDHDMVGFNYRMTNIQAAVGCAQLERLEVLVAKKRQIRNIYEREFDGVNGIQMFPNPSYQQSACWFSGIVFDDGNLDKVRYFCEELRKHDIEARSFWKPVHLQRPYRNAVKDERLETASALWNRILTLPCSTNITEQEIVFVADAVKDIIKSL